MKPLPKAILAIVILQVASIIWFGFVGLWTLIAFPLYVAGGWLIGELAAEAEGYRR